MMRTEYQIRIPAPCHENWAEMTAVEKGRFCGACQKKVHDFTRASDREILHRIQNENEICGIFLGKQLNRDLVATHRKSRLWLAAVSGIVGMLPALHFEAKAQTPVGQTDNEPIYMLGK